MENQDIGDRILKARVMSGYSQSELANICGVQPGEISAWEMGTAQPSGSQMEVLRDVLNIAPTDDSEDTIGGRIRKARTDRNMSQQALANEINVADGSSSISSFIVSRWERNVNKPYPRNITHLASVLDVTEEYLLYGDREAPKANGDTIGGRIKKERIQNEYSWAELAEICGVSLSTVSRWERGKTKPNRHRVLKLADAFGVSPSYLLNGEDGDYRIPDNPPETIGQRIRAMRIDKGYSCAMLAKMCDCATGLTELKWEQDKSMPKPYALDRLCRIFGVSRDYILGHIEPDISDGDTFGSRLKAIRESRHYNIREMASQCGVSTTAYARWEHDECVPNDERISTLCGILGVSANTLRGPVEDVPDGPCD